MRRYKTRRSAAAFPRPSRRRRNPEENVGYRPSTPEIPNAKFWSVTSRNTLETVVTRDGKSLGLRGKVPAGYWEDGLFNPKAEWAGFEFFIQRGGLGSPEDPRVIPLSRVTFEPQIVDLNGTPRPGIDSLGSHHTFRAPVEERVSSRKEALRYTDSGEVRQNEKGEFLVYTHPWWAGSSNYYAEKTAEGFKKYLDYLVETLDSGEVLPPPGYDQWADYRQVTEENFRREIYENFLQRPDLVKVLGVDRSKPEQDQRQRREDNLKRLEEIREKVKTAGDVSSAKLSKSDIDFFEKSLAVEDRERLGRRLGLLDLTGLAEYSIARSTLKREPQEADLKQLRAELGRKVPFAVREFHTARENEERRNTFRLFAEGYVKAQEALTQLAKQDRDGLKPYVGAKGDLKYLEPRNRKNKLANKKLVVPPQVIFWRWIGSACPLNAILNSSQTVVNYTAEIDTTKSRTLQEEAQQFKDEWRLEGLKGRRSWTFRSGIRPSDWMFERTREGVSLFEEKVTGKGGDSFLAYAPVYGFQTSDLYSSTSSFKFHQGASLLSQGKYSEARGIDDIFNPSGNTNTKVKQRIAKVFESGLKFLASVSLSDHINPGEPDTLTPEWAWMRYQVTEGSRVARTLESETESDSGEERSSYQDPSKRSASRVSREIFPDSKILPFVTQESVDVGIRGFKSYPDTPDGFVAFAVKSGECFSNPFCFSGMSYLPYKPLEQYSKYYYWREGMMDILNIGAYNKLIDTSLGRERQIEPAIQITKDKNENFFAISSAVVSTAWYTGVGLNCGSIEGPLVAEGLAGEDKEAVEKQYREVAAREKELQALKDLKEPFDKAKEKSDEILRLGALIRKERIKLNALRKAFSGVPGVDEDLLKKWQTETKAALSEELRRGTKSSNLEVFDLLVDHYSAAKPKGLGKKAKVAAAEAKVKSTNKAIQKAKKDSKVSATFQGLGSVPEKLKSLQKSIETVLDNKIDEKLGLRGDQVSEFSKDEEKYVSDLRLLMSFLVAGVLLKSSPDYAGVDVLTKEQAEKIAKVSVEILDQMGDNWYSGIYDTTKLETKDNLGYIPFEAKTLEVANNQFKIYEYVDVFKVMVPRFSSGSASDSAWVPSELVAARLGNDIYDPVESVSAEVEGRGSNENLELEKQSLDLLGVGRVLNSGLAKRVFTTSAIEGEEEIVRQITDLLVKLEKEEDSLKVWKKAIADEIAGLPKETDDRMIRNLREGLRKNQFGKIQETLGRLIQRTTKEASKLPKGSGYIPNVVGFDVETSGVATRDMLSNIRQKSTEILTRAYPFKKGEKERATKYTDMSSVGATAWGSCGVYLGQTLIGTNSFRVDPCAQCAAETGLLTLSLLDQETGPDEFSLGAFLSTGSPSKVWRRLAESSKDVSLVQGFLSIPALVTASDALSSVPRLTTFRAESEEKNEIDEKQIKNLQVELGKTQSLLDKLTAEKKKTGTDEALKARLEGRIVDQKAEIKSIQEQIRSKKADIAERKKDQKKTDAILQDIFKLAPEGEGSGGKRVVSVSSLLPIVYKNARIGEQSLKRVSIPRNFTALDIAQEVEGSFVTQLSEAELFAEGGGFSLVPESDLSDFSGDEPNPRSRRRRRSTSRVRRNNPDSRGVCENFEIEWDENSGEQTLTAAPALGEFVLSCLSLLPQTYGDSPVFRRVKIPPNSEDNTLISNQPLVADRRRSLQTKAATTKKRRDAAGRRARSAALSQPLRLVPESASKLESLEGRVKKPKKFEKLEKVSEGKLDETDVLFLSFPGKSAATSYKYNYIFSGKVSRLRFRKIRFELGEEGYLDQELGEAPERETISVEKSVPIDLVPTRGLFEKLYVDTSLTDVTSPIQEWSEFEGRGIVNDAGEERLISPSNLRLRSQAEAAKLNRGKDTVSISAGFGALTGLLNYQERIKLGRPQEIWKPKYNRKLSKAQYPLLKDTLEDPSTSSVLRLALKQEQRADREETDLSLDMLRSILSGKNENESTEAIGEILEEILIDRNLPLSIRQLAETALRGELRGEALGEAVSRALVGRGLGFSGITAKAPDEGVRERLIGFYSDPTFPKLSEEDKKWLAQEAASAEAAGETISNYSFTSTFVSGLAQEYGTLESEIIKNFVAYPIPDGRTLGVMKVGLSEDGLFVQKEDRNPENRKKIKLGDGPLRASPSILKEFMGLLWLVEIRVASKAAIEDGEFKKDISLSDDKRGPLMFYVLTPIVLKSPDSDTLTLLSPTNRLQKVLGSVDSRSVMSPLKEIQKSVSELTGRLGLAIEESSSDNIEERVNQLILSERHRRQAQGIALKFSETLKKFRLVEPASKEQVKKFKQWRDNLELGLNYARKASFCWSEREAEIRSSLTDSLGSSSEVDLLKRRRLSEIRKAEEGLRKDDSTRKVRRRFKYFLDQFTDQFFNDYYENSYRYVGQAEDERKQLFTGPTPGRPPFPVLKKGDEDTWKACFTS